MHRITEVRPSEGLTVHLTYQDGATVHADLSPLLAGEAGIFAPLRDRAFFEQVSLVNRGRGITWPGELDLDGDTLRMSDDDPTKPPGSRILSSTPGTPPDPASMALREAIRASGLTQEEVARRAGIQQSNLARMLDPNYHGHTMKLIRQVAAAIGREPNLTLPELPNVQ